jgi:hypothetical protein
MSALNSLKFAVNRMTEEMAARVLNAAGVKFRVGASWASYDEDGKLVNDSGDAVNASASSFTGVEILGEQRTSNGIVRGTEMQPTPGGPGSADYIPSETTTRGHQLVNRGTGEVIRTEKTNIPGVTRTVAAPPTQGAEWHAAAAQNMPVPGSDAPVEVHPNSGGIGADDPDGRRTELGSESEGSAEGQPDSGTDQR